MSVAQYTRRYAARLLLGDGNVETVTVPDHVAADQRGAWERSESFAVLRGDGTRITCIIDGNATGFGGAGVGDLTVTLECGVAPGAGHTPGDWVVTGSRKRPGFDHGVYFDVSAPGKITVCTLRAAELSNCARVAADAALIASAPTLARQVAEQAERIEALERDGVVFAKYTKRLQDAAGSAADWLCDCETGTDQRDRGDCLRAALKSGVPVKDERDARIERLEKALNGAQEEMLHIWDFRRSGWRTEEKAVLLAAIKIARAALAGKAGGK